MITIEGLDRLEAKLSRIEAALLNLDSGPSYVDIYVPTNAPAAQYGKKIHDERGQTWHNRGLGTIAKGPQAKEKFIKRAIDTNWSSIRELLADALADGVRAMKTKNIFADALRRIGMVVQRDARDNAPRSPSKAQYKRGLKTKRGQRFSRATLTPGGLERSIVYEVG